MTDTLELDLGWRPGDLVRARYRLLESVERPDGVLGFEALDVLTGEAVQLAFRDPSTEDVVITPAAETAPLAQAELPFGARPFAAPSPPQRAIRAARTLARQVLARQVLASAALRVRLRDRASRIAVGVLVAVALGVVVYPRYETVPDLAGLSRTAAQAALQEASLSEGVVSLEFHDAVPPGAVAGTTPNAGVRARRGSGVAIVLSRGPRLVEVPDVVGKPTAEARAVLSDAGLSVRGTKDISHRARTGTVVDQDPKDERIPRGSAVDLVVSKGPRR